MTTHEKKSSVCELGTGLDKKRCVPCEGGVPPLSPAKVQELLKTELAEDWQVSTNQKEISRDFIFKNFYQTMAFVNAIAWMAHYEDHHPDLEVGYKHCLVKYTTHAIDGLSENDFICAKKVDDIFIPFQESL